MSETKHTPGPWQWTHIRQRGGLVSGILRGEFMGKPAVYPIINSPGVIDGLCVEVDQANADLIAAAPELLEACREALPYLSSVGGTREQYAHGLITAAIAKAEGRS